MSKLRLTKRLKQEIINHAQGSLFRINAGSADCYVFSIYRNKSGKLDFKGGWDWSNNLVDKDQEWIYMLKTGEFKPLEVLIK